LHSPSRVRILAGAQASIQAGLKAFTAFGVFGASAITALTAQNTLGVRSVVDMEPAFVVAQIDAVMDDLPLAVVSVNWWKSSWRQSSASEQLTILLPTLPPFAD
jgi:hydroxymethylpyrimidine/phosphomethylpyrimidine kinase